MCHLFSLFYIDIAKKIYFLHIIYGSSADYLYLCRCADAFGTNI